jgi:1-deoxy-D-xylulose-5-phosphate synthase
MVLMAVGASVMEALGAHEMLDAQGIQATVVDCRFIKPLDAALAVDLARRIPRIVTIEENVRQGGFGSAVLEALNDAGLNSVAVERIGLPDAFVEHGRQSLLRSKYGLDAASIARTALRFFQRNGRAPVDNRPLESKIASIRL